MKWNIELNNLALGGFAPRWFDETYPSYGNKNQAGAMTNCDLTIPGYLTQGPGLAALTNGTQAAAVSTLIKGMTDFAVASNVAYGVGGAKLYKYSATAVTSDATWPHTISHDGSELGEDVALYQGNLYYSYNQASDGDIGKYDLASTFDDDWGSNVPTGAALLTNNPHPMVSGGNDVLYIGNGRYVADYNGTALDTQALDLPTGAVIQDIKWCADRLWIAANKTNISGTNRNQASVYIWDGTSDSWETEIPLVGTVGGLHVKNGVVFVWYQDISGSAFELAYLTGGSVSDPLMVYPGGLPAFYQKTDYKGFIIWNSNGSVYAWGAGSKDLPVRGFQLADGGHATVGGISCPFGTPIIASNVTTSFQLAKFSGYDVTSTWKSLMFDISGGDKNTGIIEQVRFNIEGMATGARVDWSLVDNKGKTIYSDTIAFAKNGAETSIYYPIHKGRQNFRVELNFANGSASNPVKIKNIKVNGSI